MPKKVHGCVEATGCFHKGNSGLLNRKGKRRAVLVHSEEVCVSFCCSDKPPKESSLKKEKFASAPGFRHCTAESLGSVTLHLGQGRILPRRACGTARWVSSCEARSQEERRKERSPISPWLPPPNGALSPKLSPPPNNATTGMFNP